MKKVFNFKWGTITLNVGDGDETPAELMVYDTIGKDPWSEGGISASDFKQALDAITPNTRPLNIRVNSRGGDVHEGMAMMNLLNQYPGNITTTIDGVAASTASWAFIGPADKVVAGKGTQVFIHDAMTFCFGNAEQLKKNASDLDKTSDQIAGMYADKSAKATDESRRKTKDEMRGLMKNETLLTGEEAAELGLVDEIIDKKSVSNFTAREIAHMHNTLVVMTNKLAVSHAAKPATVNTMNKKQIIAILNTAGMTQFNGVAITEEMSDETLHLAMQKMANDAKTAVKTEATPADLKAIKDELDRLKEINEAGRKNRITSAIDALIANDQMTKSEREKAIARCLKDETYLDELNARPATPPGAAPLTKPSVEVYRGDVPFNEVQKHILDRGSFIFKNFGGNNAPERVGPQGCLAVRDNALERAKVLKQHRNMILQMWNTNAIDAGLQRQVIMMDILEEFAIRILAMQAFSVVYSNIPLEGTDEVDVPFFPLQTAASNSWSAAAGYAVNNFSNTMQNTRPVVVGGSGTASGTLAAAGTCKDRKWLGMLFASYELARQPYQNWAKLYSQNGNKLAIDVFGDFISRVIQPVNFGNSVKSVPAAAFGADDVADLYSAATGLNWPEGGRYLTFNHPYNAALLKDPSYKYALNYGSTDPIRKAKITEAYGFENIFVVPNLNVYFTAANQQGNPAATDQYVQGWINQKNAALFATAPIMPTPEVRALISSYDLVIHPDLGVALEFRRYGDLTLDQSRWTVECSYGGNKGVASALSLITSQ